MNWIVCETIEYSALKKLTLYRSEDNHYLRFTMEVGLSTVSTAAFGTYIQIQVEGEDNTYYAMSSVSIPGTEAYKIYIAAQ